MDTQRQLGVGRTRDMGGECTMHVGYGVFFTKLALFCSLHSPAHIPLVFTF